MDPKQPPVLPEDSNPELLSGESAPESGSFSSETALGSEPKRQKIEEAAVEKSSSDKEEAEDKEWTEVSVNMEPAIYYPQTQEGVEKLERFYQQVEESEGFDFDEFPPVDYITRGVYPVGLKSGWRPFVDDCVKHVVKEQNDKNAELKGDLKLNLDTVEITRINMRPCGGHSFYITFEATNELASRPEDARKVYQAHVYQDALCKCHTRLLRVKGDKGQIRGEGKEFRAKTYAAYH